MRHAILFVLLLLHIVVAHTNLTELIVNQYEKTIHLLTTRLELLYVELCSLSTARTFHRNKEKVELSELCPENSLLHKSTPVGDMLKSQTRKVLNNMLGWY